MNMMPNSSDAMNNWQGCDQTNCYPPQQPYATMQTTSYQRNPMQNQQTDITRSQMTYTGPTTRSNYPPGTVPGETGAPMIPNIVQPGTRQPIQPSGRTSIMSAGQGARGSVLVGTDFTQGYLTTQIGRYVKVEFLIGTNTFQDREGWLLDVGTDFIILQEAETDDQLLCDLYSIKFVKFYY